MQYLGIICVQMRQLIAARVTYVCVSELTSIGSYKGLSPGRRQAITWAKGMILIIGPLGTNLSEI